MVAVRHLIIHFPYRGATEDRSPISFSKGNQTMSTLTILGISVSILILVWAIWFIVRLIQYVVSGEYEVDKRLKDVCR
jgi:hypothetical protein